MKTSMPPQEQIDIAVMWLESNNDQNGEADACKAVAAWLDRKAGQSILRRHARGLGVPVARLRRKLAEQSR